MKQKIIDKELYKWIKKIHFNRQYANNILAIQKAPYVTKEPKYTIGPAQIKEYLLECTQGSITVWLVCFYSFKYAKIINRFICLFEFKQVG